MVEIKLNELRRYAIANRTRITYRTRDGRVSVVTVQGIVEIPGVTGPPPYNSEEVLREADEFLCAMEDGKTSTLTREAMAEMLKKVTPAAAAPSKEE